jgi:hypothetical protein
MLARNEQDMSGEEGMMVEKGERVGILEDDVGHTFAADDLAERAVSPSNTGTIGPHCSRSCR